MKCPRCGSDVRPLQAQCPQCEFALATVVQTFGHKLVKLDRLTDAANRLRLRDIRSLESLLEELEATFPQVFFAVYFGILPPSFSLGELSFWLLNHSAFNTEDLKKLNEYAVLMVIDPVGKHVGINVGYALEPLLPESRLQKILQQARTPLWHAEYVSAVTQSLQSVCKILKKGGKPSRAETGLSPPETTQEFLGRSGLRALRPRAGLASSPPEADLEWRYQKDPETESSDDDGKYT